MNLIITDQCNRSCPYCFAGRKVVYPGHKKGAQFNAISMQAVDWYLDFNLRSGINDLKLLGGEPSLHPRLSDIVIKGLDRGMRITMFTNGIWPKTVTTFFSTHTDERVSFVFNINEPSLQTPNENEKQLQALAVAGNRAMIGFNIYQENFDLLFIKDLVNKFSLKRKIRLGLASPIVGAGNSYLPNKVLGSVGRRLAAQLKELETHDILGAFDCGFPMCMFEPDDLGSLALTTVHGFASLCGSVIDVGPDLNTWPCFPLSGLLNIHLPDFNNWIEVDEYFRNKTAPLRSFGSMDSCLDCKFLRREQCVGGCLARTVNSWMESGDTRLVEKLNFRQ